MSGSYTPAKQDAIYTDLATISNKVIGSDDEIKGPRAEIRAGVQKFFKFNSSISFVMLFRNIFKDQSCGKRTAYLILLLLILLASVFMPLYMIVEGVKSLDKCPRMPMIPKWLIILGAIVFFNTVVNFGILGFFSLEKVGIIKRILQMLTFFSHLVLVILGAIWIFRIAYILKDPNSTECNYTTYRTAFVHLVVFLTFNIILILILIFYIISKFVKHARK